MEKMKFKSIPLGKKDGVGYVIAGASRDCGRYRGLGYVQTRDSHQHFDNVGLGLLVGRNGKELILDEFSKKLQDEKARRNLVAYFRHLYHLKERAEFLKNGGHVNELSLELLEYFGTQEERVAEITKINCVHIPNILQKIEDLYS